MPNHVRNRLAIDDAEKAKEMLSFMRSDDSEFDFDMICPIPPHVYKGDISNVIAEIFGARKYPFDDKLVNVFESGDTWLYWCSEHWGTKWNAYGIERVSDNEIQFDTAWNPVPRIVLLLAHKFGMPDLEYEWADEDFGSNAGRMTLKDGRVDVYRPDNGSKGAFDVAAKLRPDYLRSESYTCGAYWDEENGEIAWGPEE